MELLGSFYRRKFRRKSKRPERDLGLGRSDGALCKSPSEASVNSLATGLISKVLRLTSRRSESASRPHSWHSTKLGDGLPEHSMMQISPQGSMGAPWHHNYHSSSSTTDLSGYEAGFLRKSPDQYSSRGSMESLDPPLNPTYSSCHQLSASKSSSSIDHLHSKRDSAYSSFSTSSSIPEYLAAGPTFTSSNRERSCSMEHMPQSRGGGGGGMTAEGMQQADIRYVRTIYDPQGPSQEHEVTSAALGRTSDSRGQMRSGVGGGGGVGGVGTGPCHRAGGSSSSSSSGGSSSSASHRHSLGPVWGSGSHNSGRSSCENLKGAPQPPGAPPPPQRSDSYAAIRNHNHHERPNSWSSLEQARSLRALHKGSWHHSSGSVAAAAGGAGGKPSFVTEGGQLHTVVEKSPESSPTTRPKQGFPPQPAVSSASQPGAGRPLYPTSVYQVPQPEPHFAQMPTNCPSSSTVYPALAKESRYAPPRELAGGGGGGGGGGGREGALAVENGYQSSSSSSHMPHGSTSPPHLIASSSQPKSLPQAPSLPPPPPHSHSQHLQHHQHQERGPDEAHTKYRSHLQPPNSHNPASRPASASSSIIAQERRDPYTPVLPRGEKGRYGHSPEPQSSQQQLQLQQQQSREEAELARHLEQGSHVEPLQTNAATRSGGGSSLPPRHYSESSALRDQEHPLTRLENALAEVQRCASPESGSAAGSGGSQNYPPGGERDRSVSVLERVSRFERRDPPSGKARSHSISHAGSISSSSSSLSSYPSSSSHYRPNHAPVAPKSSLSGVEDLRNMLDRSSATSHYAVPTSSYANTHGYGAVNQELHHGLMDLHQRRASTDQERHRYPPDTTSQVLQRSKSVYHVGEENGSSASEWRDDPLDILGTIQDTTYNRAYRDSIKGAQSKVLRSTSFQRRDMNPPAVPPKHASLERKGPKTSPKPTTSTTNTTNTTTTSPHTPKERHVVTPDLPDRSSPPELPSMPPVGPPVVRICGRKRLTMEQKKRSYSEPENMHEVGLSDSDISRKQQLQQFLIPESSVADRRKMFEMAANRNAKQQQQQQQLQLLSVRPELKQMQQDALAEYMKRKTGQHRPAPEGGRPSRPQSAYLHHQTSSSSTDSRSLSSTSSLASLQDPGLLESLSGVTAGGGGGGGGGRQIYTLPANLRGDFYTTSNRWQVAEPQQHAAHHRPQSKTPEPQWLQDRHPVDRDRDRDRDRRASASASLAGASSGPDVSQLRQLPQQQRGEREREKGGFERGGGGRSSGKSASAEDLLERQEKRPAPQHARSRSSPSDRFNQDFMAAELKSFAMMSMDVAPSSSHTVNRSVAPVKPERPSSASAAMRSDRYLLNQSGSQANAPVMRRDRQRHGERQRAQSAAGLAASVGLPSPLSAGTSAGVGASSGQDWQQASVRLLCPANLDHITFPSTPHGGAAAATSQSHPARRASAGMIRQYSSETSTSEDTVKDFPSGGGSGGGKSAPPKTPPLALAPTPAEKAPLAPAVAPATTNNTTPPELPPKTFRAGSTTPSPPLVPSPSRSPEESAQDHPQPPAQKPLLSLRISESALCFTPEVKAHSLEDDVFLQDVPPPLPPQALAAAAAAARPPPPSSSSSASFRETDLTEDFPPPPQEEELLAYHHHPHHHHHHAESQMLSSPAAVSPPPKSHLSAEASVDDPSVCDRRASRASRESCSLSPPPSQPPLSPEPSSAQPAGPAAPAAIEVEDEEAEDESLGLDSHLLSRRERSEAERRVEMLARELVSRDKSLTPLLESWAGRGRSSMDMMEELFPAAYGHGTQQQCPSSRQQRRSSSSSGVVVHGDQEDRSPGGETGEAQESLDPAKRMETDLDEDDTELTQKQGELLQALVLSVAVLKAEREQLAEEQRACAALGAGVEALVQEKCKPNERDKYRVFIGDQDKMVNLLLSLSRQLARVDSSLATLERHSEEEREEEQGEEETQDHAEERESLQQKRRQLVAQQEDARELKENLDRRQRVVLRFLSGYLTRDQLRQHRRHVRLKPALLIRQRHLDQLIRLGEDQLQRLADSLDIQPNAPSPPPPPPPVAVALENSAPCIVPAPRSTAVTSL
ncbi:protein Shroom3 isoform X2 [Engraulis encrasicolus]|uniref:protein Shroom3 isoform X2 n=1 Tax=Engraulis encrasicolus TaxID=184585 RepID=UPI002FD441AB